MKHLNQLSSRFATFVHLAIACGLMTTSAFAKQGATDAIPGTSNGATNTKSGGTKGGGNKSSTVSTTTVTPPAPVQPLVTAQLNFTAAASVNGVIPQCSGSYHIDPYYPTLSLMTVDVSSSSVNVPDGTVLYLTVNGTGGTLYPFTSNAMAITAQSGSCSHSVYVTPGTTITSVVIADAAGNIIFAGK